MKRLILTKEEQRTLREMRTFHGHVSVSWKVPSVTLARRSFGMPSLAVQGAPRAPEFTQSKQGVTAKGCNGAWDAVY